jgi:hypothetical protein
MAFIRIKKVKDWKYAYLVENKWKSKKTKQKVKGYLGRVYPLENIVGLEFDRSVKGLGYKDAIVELVKFELMKNGFKEGKGVLKKEDFVVNFKESSFRCRKKPAVFESNEGFICSHTFRKVMNFKPHESEEETALQLAELILGAGISIPHNVFVKLFEKVQKPEMPLIVDTQKFINKA